VRRPRDGFDCCSVLREAVHGLGVRRLPHKQLVVVATLIKRKTRQSSKQKSVRRLEI
jgi:hypothetical protein